MYKSFDNGSVSVCCLQCTSVSACQRDNSMSVCQYVSVSISAFQGHCVRGFVTVLALEYTHKVMSVCRLITWDSAAADHPSSSTCFQCVSSVFSDVSLGTQQRQYMRGYHKIVLSKCERDFAQCQCVSIFQG